VAGVVNYHCKDLGLKITMAKLFELKTAMSATISMQSTCNCWNLIKCPLAPSISPRLYSRTGRGGPSIWYPRQEVLSSSPDHTYSVVSNYFHLQKSTRWGSCSTNQWRLSLSWHAVGGMLKPDKRPPRPFYIT
jgi:hypothetical protein